jgi:hypothetical protein
MSAPQPPVMSGCATIAATDLYWSRLPPQPRQLDARQRMFRFEHTLPVPVDSLHVIGVPLGDGGALMIGIDPERLRAILAQRPDIDAGTWALLPDRIPAHCADATTAAALPQLNLLQGPFEPAPRRLARRKRDLAVGLGLAVAVLLILIGIERRVLANESLLATLDQQRQEQLAELLGPSADGLPASARLTQELRRLEQAARSPATTTVDATRILDQLWASWPTSVRAQVETVSLTAERLLLRGLVPSLADAQAIAKACPRITVDGRTLIAAPLQAEQTAQGATFLLSWSAATATPRGGRP